MIFWSWQGEDTKPPSNGSLKIMYFLCSLFNQKFGLPKMCVCVCVCMCVCVCAYTYTNTYIYICMYVCAYITGIVLKRCKCKSLSIIKFLRNRFSSMLGRRGGVVKGVEHISANLLVNIWVSGAGSHPAGSVGRGIWICKKLHYQYLTTSVAVVLVVRWYFNG